jgi:hypothetical protein
MVIQARIGHVSIKTETTVVDFEAGDVDVDVVVRVVEPAVFSAMAGSSGSSCEGVSAAPARSMANDPAKTEAACFGWLR